MKCSICKLPFKKNEPKRGTGDGTGQSFAHNDCYWRREAEPIEPTLAWVRKQIAAIEADERYHYEPASVRVNAPLALTQVGMTSSMFVLRKVQKLLEGKRR